MDSLTGNSVKIKQMNRVAILTALLKNSPATVTQLAAEINLTAATITNILSEFVTEGLVLEAGHAESNGGRRPRLYEVNRSSRVFWGIDIQVEQIVSAIMDFGRGILNCRITPFDARLGPIVALHQVGLVMEEMMTEQELPLNQLYGIGISTPGPIDYARGIILHPPNLSGWNQVPFHQMAVEKFHVPCYLERDANAAAFGESRAGDVCIESLLYVFADVGIGSGIIINGEIYRGAYGGAGEIGHVQVKPDGAVCNCGQNGCLETVSSGLALQKLAGGNGSRPLVSELLALSAKGDASVNRCLQTAGVELGRVIANVCNILNPGTVILGGRLGTHSDIYFDTVLHVARQNILFQFSNRTRMLKAKLGDYSSAVGAASIAFRNFVNAIE